MEADLNELKCELIEDTLSLENKRKLICILQGLIDHKETQEWCNERLNYIWSDIRTDFIEYYNKEKNGI